MIDISESYGGKRKIVFSGLVFLQILCMNNQRLLLTHFNSREVQTVTAGVCHCSQNLLETKLPIYYFAAKPHHYLLSSPSLSYHLQVIGDTSYSSTSTFLNLLTDIIQLAWQSRYFFILNHVYLPVYILKLRESPDIDCTRRRIKVHILKKAIQDFFIYCFFFYIYYMSYYTLLFFIIFTVFSQQLS